LTATATDTAYYAGTGKSLTDIPAGK